MTYNHDPYMALSSSDADEPEPVVEPDVVEPVVPDGDKSGFSEDVLEVLEGSAGEVMAYVDGDVDKARVVLAAEQEREKPRKGLSNELAELIAESETPSE